MSRAKRNATGALPVPAVFAALLVIIVAVAAAVLLTRGDDGGPGPATSPEATPSPTDHALTNAEAIARFKELDRARIKAFEARDSVALRQLFSPKSPELARGLRTIRKLQRDGVFMSHEPYRTLGMRVVRHSEDQIEIEQEVLFHIEFVTENGKPVTTRGRPERLTVRWKLEFLRGGWVLADGQIVKAKAA